MYYFVDEHFLPDGITNALLSQYTLLVMIQASP